MPGERGFVDFNRLFAKIPRPDIAEVWLDFDGTLTRRDVVDSLIRRYAATDDWRTLEDAWQAGEIGSRECLTGQLALIRISEKNLANFLASIALDPGAVGLFDLLHRHGVRATILSDGIDWFIERILRAHGLSPPTIRSNTLVRDGHGWQLACPHFSTHCPGASAHCKCASIERLETPGQRRIYVGDGRSDLCAARTAHLRFAKSALAELLDKEGLEYLPFTTLDDVCRFLEAAWSKPQVRVS
jgi:2,3-diketo-5-methylthio-1-phosphopentane phosphatase